MRARKLISLVVSMSLAASVLLMGCSGSGNDSSETKKVTNDVADTSKVETEGSEPYEVIMTYVTLGSTPDDLQLIEDAVNEISIPAVNAKVTLLPMSAADRATTVSLMISSGEKLDLMISFYEGGIGTYANKGQIIELDDLYATYGADIEAAEGIAMAGGYFDGKLYAIPAEEKMGRQFGMILRTDILEKYEFDMTDDVTYEKMDELFAKVAVGEGDGFTMFASAGATVTTFEFTHLVDSLGASVASGSLMNGGLDSTEIVNMFATEEYKTHLDWMRKWYEAGYFPKDATTMTDSGTDLMKTGNYFGSFGSTETNMAANCSRDFGYDMTVVNFTDRSAMTQMYQISQWAIPITCDDPETTFKFLNLMYESEEITNLLTNGIEGKHYVKTEDKGIITYPEGVDVTTTGYNSPLQLYGDKSLCYQWTPVEGNYFEELATFNASMDESVQSKALGYTFNFQSLKAEYAAVQDVIQQYQGALETGSVDPDVILPEFLSALEAAGMQTLIEENQSQLDAWLESK